jgi:hypothetical protein
LTGWTANGEEVELDSTGGEIKSIQDHAVVTFPVHKPHPVRRIRFTHVGNSQRGAPTLILSCLEIFGDIIH